MADVPEDPQPPTLSAEALRVIRRIEARRKREKAWRDRKGAAEKTALKANLRANWGAKKVVYNKNRRERLEKERDALAKENIVIVRGRPAVARIAALTQRAAKPYTGKQNETIQHLQQIMATVVSAKAIIPDDIRTAWKIGEEEVQKTINISKDPLVWPATSMKRWYGDPTDVDLGYSVLKDNTKMGYMGAFLRLLREVGFKDIPFSRDPFVLGKFVIGWDVTAPQFDIWDIVRKCVALHPDVKAQTECSKSLTAVLNATVLKLLEDTAIDVTSAKFTRAFTYPQITIFWNKIGKKKTNADREAGIVSDKILDAIVPWPDWKKAATAYLESVLKENVKSVPELRDAAVVALYSQIPPIRLDWRRVRIAATKPVKNDNGNYPKINTILLDAEGVPTTAYFNEFKNAASFDSPVEISIASPPLLRAIIAKYWKQTPVGTTYLLPKAFRGEGKTQEFPDAAMGTTVRRMSMKLVKKPFTNIPMRRSFITNYYEEHPDPLTLAESRVLLRSLHQTTLSTHLGYVTKGIPDVDLGAHLTKEETERLFKTVDEAIIEDDPEIKKAHEATLAADNSLARTAGVDVVEEAEEAEPVAVQKKRGRKPTKPKAAPKTAAAAVPKEPKKGRKAAVPKATAAPAAPAAPKAAPVVQKKAAKAAAPKNQMEPRRSARKPVPKKKAAESDSDSDSD